MKGPYLMLQAFLPLLVETAKKADTVVDVINVSSIGAQLTVPEVSSYQCTKFALCRLSEFVTVEYGAKGVNCVTLNPGGVLTKLSSTGPPWIKASQFCCRIICLISD
jgi:short-subunit dehydrogenase